MGEIRERENVDKFLEGSLSALVHDLGEPDLARELVSYGFKQQPVEIGRSSLIFDKQEGERGCRLQIFGEPVGKREGDVFECWDIHWVDPDTTEHKGIKRMSDGSIRVRGYHVEEELIIPIENQVARKLAISDAKDLLGKPKMVFV